MPSLQHRAILGDAILSLARLFERRGVDTFHADEHTIDPGAPGLVDESPNLVRHRVDLRDDLDRQAFYFAHSDQPVENRLPVSVAGEVIVRDEEVVYALREIGAHELFDIVRAAHARFAPLDIDDRAKAAQERTAAAGIEARANAAGATDDIDRQIGDGGAFQARQIVHKVVERFQFTAIRGSQEVIESSFRLARAQGE